MANLPLRLPGLSLALLTALAPACSNEGGGDDSCTGGKCDDIGDENAGCTSIENQSGRPISLGDLVDPVAQLVLQPSGSCPTTFSDVMAKIAANQKGCSGDYLQDTSTHVVSEQAQNARRTTLPNGNPVSYRLVTLRTCADQPQHSVLLSLPALAGDTAASLDKRPLELIGLDETAGVFNYYRASDQAGWEFVGDSRDMVAGGECGACHTGGGLVMKELHTPWIYWEEPTGVPATSGVAALFVSTQTTVPGGGQASILGTHDDLSGITMEKMVRAGNLRWNETRADDAVKSGTLKDLLRPLFCTQEINLDSGKNPGGGIGPLPPIQTLRIAADFLLDPRLLGRDTVGTAEDSGGITVPRAEYDAARLRAGQSVPIVEQADTALPFLYPERSELEHNFVMTLVERGVIDDDFAVDVLAVDFTRPIFSDDRCGLLELLPDVKVADLPPPSSGADTTPNRVRAAVVAALGEPANGTAAAQLARHIAKVGDAATHVQRAADFVAACKALPTPDFLDRTFQVVSQRRKLAATAQSLHNFPGAVIESPIMLPTDTLDVDDAIRFHPVTCELTSELVALE